MIATRTATADKVDQIPGRYEVTDGGVYIRVGDTEIAVTSRRLDDDDVTRESLLRARKVVQNLIDGGLGAVAELDAALAELAAAA
jgi:hypothetical protein